jgi:hypothetical protein
MKMRGVLQHNDSGNPQEPELYVSCGDMRFPIAVREPVELEYLRTIAGQPVTFEPKALGVTADGEAVVFAVGVWPDKGA